MGTHVIMKKSLAKALMDAGVEHFDGGGVIGGGGAGGLLGGVAGTFTVQNGFNAQSPTSAGTIGNQQATLAAELQNEAAGNGPNPAQQQFLQNSQNIAQNQANTYAANRSLNPGLAARLAGQTGASLQQSAASTAATQQAEQQLAAQQQMENLTAQEQTGSLTAQGLNSQVSQANANSVNQTAGGILGGIGSAIGGVFGFAKGGKVPDHLKEIVKIYHPKHFDNGGIANLGLPNLPQVPQSGSGSDDNGGADPSVLDNIGAAAGTKLNSLMGSLLPDAAVGMKSGGDVPGKAKVKGNSVKNDTIPALLSPKEVVLPRSVTMAKDAPSKAAEFMRSVQKKEGKQKEDGDDSGYGKVARAKMSLKERIERLEKMCAGGAA